MMEIQFLNKTRTIDYRTQRSGRLSTQIELLGIYDAKTGRRCRRLENAVATLPVLQSDLIDAIQWEDPDLLVEIAL